MHVDYENFRAMLAEHRHALFAWTCTSYLRSFAEPPAGKEYLRVSNTIFIIGWVQDWLSWQPLSTLERTARFFTGLLLLLAGLVWALPIPFKAALWGVWWLPRLPWAFICSIRLGSRTCNA